MKFRSIQDDPPHIGQDSSDQILCRFRYKPNPNTSYWVYMICLPNGVTQASGYAKPEEWAYLPQ